jgi:hypothetical protein
MEKRRKEKIRPTPIAKHISNPIYHSNTSLAITC